MKVAIEARYLLSTEKTGVEYYTYMLCSLLAKQPGDHQLQLYVQRRPRPEEHTMLAPFLDSPRCHFHVVPPVRLWLKFWMPIAARLHGADIGLFPGSILPLYQPFRPIMVVHDLCWHDYPEFYPAYELDIFRNLYPRDLAASTLVFAVSEYTKQDITRIYGTPPEKIRVVYCGVDDSFAPIPNAPALVQEKWGLDPGFILSVGTSHPRKNIATLLRAYALMTQISPCPPLVLIGPGGNTAAPLAKLAGELGITDRVRWLGYVPFSELPAIFSAAAAYVMPSLYEGFGLPVLQAMTCGTPVVCANATAFPEVVADAGLLVEPKAPEAYAEALTRLLHNPDLAQELRTKGLARAQFFNSQRCGEVALRCLEETMQMPVR
jgi:glycosyltransferase involved in cell wall biosynthesis